MVISSYFLLEILHITALQKVTSELSKMDQYVFLNWYNHLAILIWRLYFLQFLYMDLVIGIHDTAKYRTGEKWR